MKFNILVQYLEGGEIWKEDYNRPEVLNLDEAKTWGQALIDRFNATLRPRERARKFVGVELAEESNAVAKHEWSKVNLMTVHDRLGVYDKMICLRCNITGKRYGMGEAGVKLDSKFRGKVFLSCDPDAIAK